MTSTERREGRYQRRKAGREKKRREFLDSLPSYDEVFTFKKLYMYFKKCRKGVRWKSSTQSYEATLLFQTATLFEQLKKRRYRSKGFHSFYINERGKMRFIQALKLSERVAQKALCDEYLVPLLRRSLIHDNSATLKGKGTDFALERMKVHLKRAFARYGSNEFYVVIYDFSGYFDSIPHDKLLYIIRNKCDDDDLYELIRHLIQMFGDKGLGLGSQVSQICAISYADAIDHTFKDRLGVKGYGRYNDDGYIVAKTLEDAKRYVEVLKAEAAKLDIKLNPRKLNIYKVSRPFPFLKKKVFVTVSGEVVFRLSQKALGRQRRKLKKYAGLLERGIMTYKEIEQAYKSWRGNAIRYRNFRSVCNMDALYDRLFIENWR